MGGLISTSPFGDIYRIERDGRDKVSKFIECNKDKRVVVVQGLGFVGSAMLAAVSLAEDKRGRRRYAVIGIDLPDRNNYWKIGRINKGLVPIISEDKSLKLAYL